MGRAPCCDKTKVKRGPWSPEEDALLKGFIEPRGNVDNWIALPRKAGLNRCGKSCRLRWLNYLRPNIRHGGFTKEEDYIICTLFSAIGSRWSVIASNLPGRTDNDIKNYWNTKLKKRIAANKVPGFDPMLVCTNTINHVNCIQSAQPNPEIIYSEMKPEPIAFDHGYNSMHYNSDPLHEMFRDQHEMSLSLSRCSSNGGGGGGGDEVEEDDMDDFWLRLLVDQSTFFGGSSQETHSHEKKINGFDSVYDCPVFSSFG